MTAKKLQQRIIHKGKRVGKLPEADEIQAYVKDQLTREIWEEEQRFENPHRHYVDMSPAYYEMKMDMLKEHSL